MVSEGEKRKSKRIMRVRIQTGTHTLWYKFSVLGESYKDRKEERTMIKRREGYVDGRKRLN